RPRLQHFDSQSPLETARRACRTQSCYRPVHAFSLLPRHSLLSLLSRISQRPDMDQGAGGATEASLTPQPAPEVSGGILHAGRGFIGNAGITLIGAVAGAVLTTGNEVLAARFLGVSAYGLYALALMLAKSGEIIAAFGVPLSL